MKKLLLCLYLLLVPAVSIAASGYIEWQGEWKTRTESHSYWSAVRVGDESYRVYVTDQKTVEAPDFLIDRAFDIMANQVTLFSAPRLIESPHGAHQNDFQYCIYNQVNKETTVLKGSKVIPFDIDPKHPYNSANMSSGDKQRLSDWAERQIQKQKRANR